MIGVSVKISSKGCYGYIHTAIHSSVYFISVLFVFKSNFRHYIRLIVKDHPDEVSVESKVQMVYLDPGLVKHISAYTSIAALHPSL